MLAALVTLIFVIAGCAIIWWLLSKISLPEPVRIVAMAVLAIIALIVLWRVLAPVIAGL